MDSNLIERSVEDIFHAVFDSSPSELLVVNPSDRALEMLIELSSEVESPPTIRLLVEERTLKAVLSDFLIASNAADLVTDDVLTIRTVDSGPENSLVITPNKVIALVTIGDTVAGLDTDDPGFVDVAYGAYESEWEAGEPYTLRTPPLSRIRTTLADELGSNVADDFDTILETLPTTGANGDEIDEVTLCLLVAAKNEVLLYDISKWGEDVGIASKATFSRTKTRLEDMGVIDTEKVPIDVGRPRLRLKLDEDGLAQASIDELANMAAAKIE